MTENAPGQFYGELWRANFEPGRAVLRFYQFAFDADVATPTVYEVTFLQPSFSYNDIEPFFEQEVQFSKTGDGALLHGSFTGEERLLVASSVTAQWQGYDIQDYINRIKQLDIMNAQLHGDLRIAHGKLNKVTSTAIELLRRAEIKAAASPERQKSQSPALEVLNRILFELE